MTETLWLWFYKTALKLHLVRLQYSRETREVDDDGQITVVLAAELKWFWEW